MGQSVREEDRSLRELRLQIIDEIVNRAELEKARHAIAAARNQYDELRSVAVTEAREQTRHRQLLAQEQALKARLRAIYHEYRYGIPPKDVTTPLAETILEVRMERTSLITAALQRDAEIIEAWQDLELAGRIYTDQIRWIPWQVRSDPRFRKALRAAGRPVR